ISGTAQVVLTHANSSPQPGDVYVRTSGQYLNPGAGGGAIYTYDYTSLSSTGGTVDTLRYTAPSDTMWYSGLVPGANAEVFLGGQAPPFGDAFYYSGTNAGLDLIGELELGSPYVMSDPRKELIYPCTAGSSWTDTYYGSVPFLGSSKGGVITVNSSIVCNVATPSGFFSNVLRLAIDDSFNYIDSEFILHRERSFTVYRKPGIHHPVMYCVTSTGYDESGNPIPGLYGEWCQWLQADISTNTQALAPTTSRWALLQNPVEDLLRVSGAVPSDVANYRIWSADGVLVREGPARDLSTGVAVDALSGGIYLLQCGGSSARFIKE
ncbi:MAG: hypothetical protein ABIY71_13670, partial [Flavobacteriales bacterium]